MKADLQMHTTSQNDTILFNLQRDMSTVGAKDAIMHIFRRFFIASRLHTKICVARQYNVLAIYACLERIRA